MNPQQAIITITQNPDAPEKVVVSLTFNPSVAPSAMVTQAHLLAFKMLESLSDEQITATSVCAGESWQKALGLGGAS